MHLFEVSQKAIRQFANCEGWWLSRSVAEQWLHKPGVLGSIPADCWPLQFPLFSPQKTSNLSLFQREARVLSSSNNLSVLETCVNGETL